MLHRGISIDMALHLLKVPVLPNQSIRMLIYLNPSRVYKYLSIFNAILASRQCQDAMCVTTSSVA